MSRFYDNRAAKAKIFEETAMLEVKPFSYRDRRFRELLNRDSLANPDHDDQALEIIASVRDGGSDVLHRHVVQHDSEMIRQQDLRVSEADIIASRDDVSEQFLTALSLARVNIRKFHEYQRRLGYVHDDGEGVRISRRARPLARVGICCGLSPAALLMFAVPAQVAGVGEIAVAAAPRPDGCIDPRILATARVLGIDEVYRMSGAHAVAAMAYGVGPVARVDKVVGPGSGLARAAKRLLQGKVGTDAELGLSELAVIADDTANAKFIAADLLAQAEHDNGSGLMALFTTDRLLAEAVRIELNRLAEELEHATMLRVALKRSGAIYVCTDLDQAVEAVNALAPARLSLMTGDNEQWLTDVENAGMVFLGPWSLEAAGDYFAGANPFLPVGGAARFASGLGVDDFVRQVTVLEYGPDRLLKTGRHLISLAGENGGKAHAAALRERLELLKLTVD